MRCEELEAIVFSGREITAEERAEMEAHAKTCEACRALMDNADALRGMQRIDEDVTPPESFTRGWRMAIRQTPRVISISDWMRRKGVRVIGYAACAALVFAGLAAEGTTYVEHIHFIERGYENIVGKLTALGADIRRTEE